MPDGGPQVTLLEESFEPSELADGYYTAYSDMPAYPILYGMTLVEEAKDEGRHYWEGGVVQILASVGMEPLTENVEERTFREGVVKIPHSYFTEVTEDYGNWREMWWREVIQNAVDAGATKIECKVKEQADGTWLVSCRDNGHGMDLDTIENVFFTLRASQKWGAARHGGFGEAKKLIALAWIKFRVLSRDVEVVGNGAEWPKLGVYEGGEDIGGTLIEVVMPADKHTQEAAAISYIQKCYIPNVQFTVNDELYSANLSSGEFKRNLSLGSKLFYNKHIKDLHAVMIRSNGLYMFDYSLPTDFKGVIFVEVYPKKDFPRPQDIFVSSRMAFKYRVDEDLRAEVESVVSKATADIKQALRAPDALLRKKYEGIGFFTTAKVDARKAIMRDIAGPLPEADPGKSLSMSKEVLKLAASFITDSYQEDLRDARGDESRLVTALDAEVAKIMLESPLKGESHLEAAIAQLVWKPDFININDESVREGFKLEKRFEPATMTASVYALARLWASYIRFILMNMGSRVEWGTGFLFSEEAQGMYYRGEGQKWILLNPYNLETRKLLSIRSEADVREIFETGMHESAHVLDGSDYHGEGFAKAMDMIVVEMLRHWKEAKRIAQKTKIRGVVKPPRERPEPKPIKPPVKRKDNCYARPFTDEPPSLLLKPVGMALDKFSSNLYIPPEQLVTFLYKKEYEDFLEKQKPTVRKKLEDARSAEWVMPARKLGDIFKETFNRVASIHPEDTGFMMPIRVWTRSDGRVAVRPADIRHARFFASRWDMTLAGTILMTEVEVADHIELLFTYNKFLNMWPYRKGPDELAEKFLSKQEVIIPIESDIYEKLLVQVYDVERKASFDPDDSLDADMSWEDNILLLSPHWSGSRDYYAEQYDISGDLFIQISDKTEQEFVVANAKMSSYEQKELLELREPVRFAMDREFFEQVLEFHLKDLKVETETEEVAAKMAYVGIFSYGSYEPSVFLRILPTNPELQAEYKQQYGISVTRPVGVFAYGDERDEILESVGKVNADHIVWVRGKDDPVIADIPLRMLDSLINKSFGDVAPVNIHEVAVIPVNLTYNINAEVLYIAPADPRQVKSLRATGLKTTDMIIKITKTNDIVYERDRILNGTYVETDVFDKKVKELEAGQDVLGFVTPAYYGALMEDYS